ncbi:MAG: NDP-sugar synthase [Promethearchaeota archaeon]|nr:MAG: NDP-sugar synthase [Candidatus Lokiarchaeota archaeon]
MRAIILSGGWGTRLRPLTCTIPKTLIPVGNTPIIERQMLNLKEAGIKEIVLAVSVMGEYLKNYFGDGHNLGLKISYTNEQSPMGTGGALKLAEPLLKDDNFIFLNGDVVFNFQFTKLIKSHQNYKGIGTIASKVVDDPSRYGVIIENKETHQIESFLEKEQYNPPPNERKPMPINAGAYVLEPKIFSYIKPRKKISLEREIFPKLVKEKQLYHFPIPGIWKDIGTPSALLEGNILLMEDILKTKGDEKENLVDESADIHPSVKINPPITVGKNTVIKRDCTIGPNAIIGDNVLIEKSCNIRDALLYQEVYVSKDSTIERAIISDNCLLRKNTLLQGNQNQLVILASYVRVNNDLQLIAPKDRPITVCHHEVVKESQK